MKEREDAPNRCGFVMQQLPYASARAFRGQLSQDAVHVHVLTSVEAYTQGFTDAMKMVDRSETERFHAFTRPADAVRFLGAHLFVREVLSTYVMLAPDSWRFRYEPGGAPSVDWDALPIRDSINFSLSHSGSAVACAVRRTRKIGVDVQERIPPEAIPILAKEALSPEERRLISALGDTSRASEVFTTLWTLKEAYLKALGIGLSVDPRRVSFAFDESGRPQLCADGIKGKSWRFQCWMHPSYILAVGSEEPEGRCSPHCFVFWDDSADNVNSPFEAGAHL